MAEITLDRLQPLTEEDRMNEITPDRLEMEGQPSPEPEKGFLERAGEIGKSVLKASVRPALEAVGVAGGGILGSAAGPWGAVAGAGGGYAVGKRIADILEGKRYELPESLKQTGKDIVTGAEMEMGGQVIGKIATKGIEYAGKLGKQVLGATTGSGPGMVEEALKGGEEFKKAMRGKTSGQEIVDNTKDALQSLKAQRASAYQKKLTKIAQKQGDLDPSPIANKVDDLMKKYNIKISKEGLDYSRVAMGKSGRKDVHDVIENVLSWGSKEGDNTPMGLDTLKRQLDDFYSDSSQARAFVAELKKTVHDTIAKAVPEYGEMTKGYAEATNLIKDIESNLMLRKSGISGRITPDQTLRRLTSAMRENFELRRDLVNILGEKGGQDLAGQIAGYSAEQIIPRGLIGKLGAGSVFWAGYYLNPKFWPLLAASSPRAVGEFLTIYGKAVHEIAKTTPATYKTFGYGLGKAMEESKGGESNAMQ